MLTLEYGSLSLALRMEDFPRRLLHPNVRVRRTVANTLRTNIKRPGKIQWSFEIRLTTKVEQASYLNFMNSAVGRSIKFTYMENSATGVITESRTVRILTDPNEVVNDARHRRTTTLLVEET